MRSHKSDTKPGLVTALKTQPPSHGKQSAGAIYRERKGKQREKLKQQQQAASHHDWYPVKAAVVSKHIKRTALCKMLKLCF